MRRRKDWEVYREGDEWPQVLAWWVGRGGVPGAGLEAGGTGATRSHTETVSY